MELEKRINEFKAKIVMKDEVNISLTETLENKEI